MLLKTAARRGRASHVERRILPAGIVELTGGWARPVCEWLTRNYSCRMSKEGIGLKGGEMSRDRNAGDDDPDYWGGDLKEQPGVGRGGAAGANVRPPAEERAGQAPPAPQDTTRDGDPRRGASLPTPASRRQEPGAEQSCVMIGPSASGKTTLLTAIKRACDLPSHDGLNLEFVPGKATAVLIKGAIDRITNRKKGHDATQGTRQFPFEIHVNGKAPNFWSAPLEADLHVVMHDGGGEYILPSDDDDDVVRRQNRAEMIHSALRATSMILCIDVTKPGNTLLEKELAISFTEMARPDVSHSPPHWSARLMSRLKRLPAPQPRSRKKWCLNVDRFLLLLTQVDKLCYQLTPSFERTIRFAEMIDPVGQARDLLGVPVMKTVQTMLKPRARFAVGVISAMGFHPVTGDPFADVDGRPLNLASESGEDILRRWTPFGIRDAIYFLATGECRGTVKEVTPGDLTTGPEPLEFSYSKGPLERG